jgi:hypothetical protein
MSQENAVAVDTPVPSTSPLSFPTSSPSSDEDDSPFPDKNVGDDASEFQTDGLYFVYIVGLVIVIVGTFYYFVR